MPILELEPRVCWPRINFGTHDGGHPCHHFPPSEIHALTLEAPRGCSVTYEYGENIHYSLTSIVSDRCECTLASGSQNIVKLGARDSSCSPPVSVLSSVPIIQISAPISERLPLLLRDSAVHRHLQTNWVLFRV